MTPTTTTTDSSSMAPMKTDSSATPVDTVKVPPSGAIQVAPVDSARMGIPATKETQAADSARADSLSKKTPPR
jgi:hypothetical protein